MLSVQIDNPNVESFLHENFNDDKTSMSKYLTDFIEKELIKKDIKESFADLKLIINGDKKANSLDSLISEISPN